MKKIYTFKLFTILLAIMLTLDLSAQQPELVADINTIASGSDPRNITPIDDKIFFSGAYRDSDSEQLYIYDSNTGTVQVITGFSDEVGPQGFVKYRDDVYFRAGDNEHGSELWKYDGTDASLVADIRPGGNTSIPQYLTVFNDKLYFRAGSDDNGIELFEYDGTSTKLIDLRPGAGNSLPRDLFVYNSELIFFAFDETDGLEPWRFNGVDAPEVLFDINPSGDSDNSGLDPYFAIYDGDLFFTAIESTDREAWVYNGTTTEKLSTKSGSLVGTDTRQFTVFQDKLYFLAFQSAQGSELWVYDGSTASMGQDLFPGSENGFPKDFIVFNDQLIFSAIGDGIGRELWSYDGMDYTSFDLTSGESETFPNTFVIAGDQLYFQVGTANGELGVYNGTNASTINLAPTNELRRLTALGSSVYFSFNNLEETSGRHLWRYDDNGLEFILTNDETGSSNPYELVGGNDNIYFLATDDAISDKIFISDGTTTSKLSDISSTPVGVEPYELTSYNGKLVYAALDDDEESELYVFDGAAVQIFDLRDDGGSSPKELTVVNGILYFNAFGNDGNRLYQYDGTGVSVAFDYANFEIGQARDFMSFGDGLYFTAQNNTTIGRELFKFDGTTATLIADINPGTANTTFGDFAYLDGILYFAASTPSGFELCRYDGTNFEVIDIFDGIESSNPTFLTVFGNELVFTAKDGVAGIEMWKYDGTTASLVANIAPGSDSSFPVEYTVFEDELYFYAMDEVNGNELRKYNGTEVTLVQDLNPGTGGSEIEVLFVNGPHLYFNAQNFNPSGGSEVGGEEAVPLSESSEELSGLWRYNGSDVEYVSPLTADDDGGISYLDEYAYFVGESIPAGSEVYRIKESSQESEIAAFSFAEQTDPVMINTTDHTVTIEVAAGTDLSSLTPTIAISEFASINPETGIAQDFSAAFTYTVTAESGNTQDWIVTVAGNTAPTVANAIGDRTLVEGFATSTIDLTNTFTDSDDDVLTISVVSSDETVAKATIADQTLTITEADVGITTVTVTANDGKGGTVNTVFTITVNAQVIIDNPNTAPTVVSPIADQVLDQGFGSDDIDLSSVFTDADGDALTFSTTSSNDLVATVTVVGNVLTVTEVGIGTANITVTANDGNNGTVTDEFVLTVEEFVTTGFGDELIGQVKVYPNPSSDYIKIDLPEGGNWSAQIFEPSGRIVKRIAEMEQSTSIAISQWKRGLYYIRIHNNNKYTTTKILID